MRSDDRSAVNQVARQVDSVRDGVTFTSQADPYQPCSSLLLSERVFLSVQDSVSIHMFIYTHITNRRCDTSVWFVCVSVSFLFSLI